MRTSLHVITLALMAGLGLTNAASAQVEKSSAINGSLYAIVAPTFNSTTVSYLRLFNGGAGATTFSVTLVGSPSGRTYGTASISVPKSASVQYSVYPAGGSPNLQTLANAGAPNGGDDSFSIYLQNPDAAAGFQHVTYNNTNAFFENASVCRYLLNDALATNNNSSVLTNVHTTLLAAYPSTVQLHNYWNAPVTYKLTMIDAASGATLGTMNKAIGANASVSIAESDIQTAMGWSPAAGQLHVNIFVTDPTGAAPQEIAGQSIINTALSAQINMSTACAVNAPASQMVGGGGGFTGY